MSGEAGNSHTGLEIGRSLQLAREKRGLSLQQVEEATKIRTRYLRDLETENFDALPAVYMLGSLKTYAGHLGLDGAAMTMELKRRQAPLQAQQVQETREDSPPRGLLAPLGRLFGIGETVEDEAGTMPDPAHSPRLYVSFAVVLVFVLATALVSSLGGESQPSISQVREPTISQIPDRTALIGIAQDDESSAEDLILVDEPEEQAEVPVRDTGKVKAGGSGQKKDVLQAAQVTSSSPTASASVPASAAASAPASVSAASTGTAPATNSSAPADVKPESAAKEETAGAGRGGEVVAAPASPPARVTGGQELHKTQVSSVSTTRLNNTTYKQGHQQAEEGRGLRVVTSQETSQSSSMRERQLYQH